MSKELVEAYFEKIGRTDLQIQLFPVSSATVPLAAQALGVAPALIAKTLAFRLKERDIVVVMCGVARLNNRKFKDTFHCKAKMMTPEEAVELVGHAVGGVCPFAVNEGVQVYLDDSLKRFETVFPACGSGNSAIELTLPELETLSNFISYVDVTKLPEA